jgi:hypothetical protein
MDGGTGGTDGSLRVGDWVAFVDEADHPFARDALFMITAVDNDTVDLIRPLSGEASDDGNGGTVIVQDVPVHLLCCRHDELEA